MATPYGPKLTKLMSDYEQGKISPEDFLAGMKDPATGAAKEIMGRLPAIKKAQMAAANLTLMMEKATVAAGMLSTAFGVMGGVLQEGTIYALKEEARARGDLSRRLKVEMDVAPGAAAARGVPIVGGAIAGFIEAVHGATQRAIGTQYYQAAAGITEGAIPGWRGGVVAGQLGVVGGILHERYRFDPEAETLAQARLGIAGPGGAGGQRRAIEAAEAVAVKESVFRRSEWEKAGRSGVGVELERMKQSAAVTAQFRSPVIMGLRGELGRLEKTQQAQAERNYVMDYAKRLQPTAAATWYAAAVGPAAPGAAPPMDVEIQQLAVLQQIAAAMRDALQGLGRASDLAP